MRVTCAAGTIVGLAVSVAVQAQETRGIQAGPITLSPFASLGATYDSNIRRASSNEDSDVYLQTALGIVVESRAEHVKGDAMGFVAQRSYSDDGDLDFWAVGEGVNVIFGQSDQVTMAVRQSYRRVEDEDAYGPWAEVAGMAGEAFLDADVRSRRNILEAGAAVDAVVSDKTDLRAAYRFNQTDYDRPTLYDLSGHSVHAIAAYRVTDKSAATLAYAGALQESDEVDGKAKYMAARVGLRTRGTDRLMIHAGAGAQQFERPEGGETLHGFHYDATATWKATDKTDIQFEGRNGYQISSILRANAVAFSVIRIGLRQQITPSIALTANGLYRIDDYEDPVLNDEGQPVDRKDKGLTLQFRAESRLPAWPIRLFAEVSHERMDSPVRDYDVSRVGVGGNVLF